MFIVHDPDDERQAAAARELNDAMIRRAIAADGTCTGEHGVGVGKRKYLVAELGEGAVGVMSAVKRSLDPKGVLNPGKVLPDGAAVACGCERRE